MDEGRPALSLKQDYLRPGTLWRPIEAHQCWLYFNPGSDSTAVHTIIESEQTVVILSSVSITKEVEYISIIKVLVGTTAAWMKIDRESSHQGDSGKISLLFKSSRKWNTIFRRVDHDVVNGFAGKV